jgi:anti-sigma factor ChrR (cupin superfamily)
MLLNADVRQRSALDALSLDWTPSAMLGVMRRRLEHDDRGLARDTSLISYAPATTLRELLHEGGEEVLVLEGELRDERGVHGAGTYLRNPPGSRRTYSSVSGCLLLVKRGHIPVRDTQTIVLDTRTGEWEAGLEEGLDLMLLAEFDGEYTALARWAPGTSFKSHRHWGGEEVYVLDGSLTDEHGIYAPGAWIRSPHLSQHAPYTDQGCTIFVKVGHLLVPDTPD